MKKIIIILTIMVTVSSILGCIGDNNIITKDIKSKTFYNENNIENYFTLYPEDTTFIYIELEKYGGQTFDLSKVGNYKIKENNIFLLVSQGIVLRGTIINETTVIDSEGTRWIKN